MDQDRIRAKLAALSELYAQRDVLQIEHDTLISEAIPDALHMVLTDIDLDYAEKKGAVAEAITALEQDVKTDVIALGASVKGDHVHAIYNLGPLRWDTKGLYGYSLVHLEIAAFRKMGKPSVSLRRR